MAYQPQKYVLFTVLEAEEFKVNVPVNPESSESPLLFEGHVLTVFHVEDGVQGLSGASLIKAQIQPLGLWSVPSATKQRQQSLD